MTGLNELKEGLGHLEFALANSTADLRDRRDAVHRRQNLGELAVGGLAAEHTVGNVLVGRDAVAEVARLVHAPHAFEQQILDGKRLSNVDATIVVAIQKEEHPVRDEEHRVNDLFHLFRNEVEQGIAAEEALLHGNLAKTGKRRHAGGGSGNLLLSQRSVAVEHFAKMFIVDRRRGGNNKAVVEKDGARCRPLEHHDSPFQPACPISVTTSQIAPGLVISPASRNMGPSSGSLWPSSPT